MMVTMMCHCAQTFPSLFPDGQCHPFSAAAAGESVQIGGPAIFRQVCVCKGEKGGQSVVKVAKIDEKVIDV